MCISPHTFRSSSIIKGQQGFRADSCQSNAPTGCHRPACSRQFLSGGSFLPVTLGCVRLGVKADQYRCSAPARLVSSFQDSRLACNFCGVPTLMGSLALSEVCVGGVTDMGCLCPESPSMHPHRYKSRAPQYLKDPPAPPSQCLPLLETAIRVLSSRVTLLILCFSR